jgi:hypothetical protein
VISLDRPTELPLEVFDLCTSRIRNTQLKGRFRSIRADVDAAAQAFLAAGLDSTFFSIPDQDGIRGIISADEMTALYDYRMARKGASGRDAYDRLIAAAPMQRCPLCAQRLVTTLDHYLPKAHYSALAVVPFNLVPACSDCNKVKLNARFLTAEEQTLHPYFDVTGNDIWLHAQAVHELPTAFRFFVEDSPTWSEGFSARVRHHFKTFRLGALYATHAAEELLNIRHGLERLHQRGGADAVASRLLEEAESRSAARVNSWQSATYRAMAVDLWFCDGGFRA